MLFTNNEKGSEEIGNLPSSEHMFFSAIWWPYGVMRVWPDVIQLYLPWTFKEGSTVKNTLRHEHVRSQFSEAL